MRSPAATPEIAEIRRLHEVIQELNRRLNEGRHYLMGVTENEITVKDALTAFGWSSDGMELD